MAFMAAMITAIASAVSVLLLRALWVTLSCYFLTPMSIRRTMAAQGVHGPSPRPLVGNLRQVSALVAEANAGDMTSLSHDIVGRLMPHYVLWSETYGKLFVYWYGSEPRLCLTDTDMIKEFLSSKYAHATGKSWLQRQGTKNFIGRGLLMANGARWSHQRHVVAPAFMPDKLKGRVGHMVECTKQTILSLRDAAARGRGEVEIGGHMTRLTGDIISRTEFDTSYETGKRIFHLLEDLQRLTARSSRYLWIPGSQYFPSKYRREIGRLNGELEGVVMESIRRSREIADEGRTTSTYGRGLLAMLLAEMEKKREKGAGDDGKFSYDTRLVIDECKTFFFAGHETSALLLTWTLMLLATHPEWQDKARAEVSQVCGDDPPSADQLSKLTVAYALFEAKVVLAMLLANFRFTISDDYRHAPVNVLTLRPKYGVPVHLRPLRP
ncbi:unnamed protein product [Triticum turgidum subsp. durum]|uniref:Cytochrome P450 n=1 Tax=Triticum turgidum subsp. durum TaxID=4567 RepID=A0A9R0X991_TRITD|nr:unnamed protein product [Triticum turgidum subsp. durum]